MSISILTAYTKKDRIIGSDGKIPWDIPSERLRFKSLCKDKKIIMGRKSYEEIGHALSYCTIVVVSKTLQKVSEGCLLARSLEEAILIASGTKEKLDFNEQKAQEILVAGGEEIYRRTLPLAEKIYATEIFLDSDFFMKKKSDEKKSPTGVQNYFPMLDENWHCTFTEKHRDFETKILYEYKTYERENIIYDL